jgi:hypothetical protein
MDLGLLITFSLLFAALFLLTGIGFSAPAVAVFCEAFSWKGKRKFWGKFAQQLSRLGLICLSIFLLLLILGLSWDCYAQGLLLSPLSNLSLPQLILPFSLLILGFALLLVYWASWKRLKKKKTAHFFLGLISALSLACTFYLIEKITIKLLTAEPFAHLDPSRWFHWLKTFQAPVSPFFWPFFVQSILVILGASGILGLIYLILRREKDVFGRDYYRWAAPFAAKWSFIFLPQILTYLWTYSIRPSDLKNSFLSIWFAFPCGLGLLLSLFAAIIWVTVINNPNPLRLKGRIVASAFLSWMALASCVLGTTAGLWPSLLPLFQKSIN